MPKVTVLLTSFNHDKYIRSAIDSVLSQTFSDFELFILDDGSTDNSWWLINQYDDPRIKAFRFDGPGKIVLQQNLILLEAVKGDYIAIHHSDDIWECNKLEKQVAILDRDPSLGAVFTNVSPITEDGRPLVDESHFYFNVFNQPNRCRHEWLRHFFLAGNALCHPSALIRRECFEECGNYRPWLRQLGDFEFWVRLALRREFHVIPEKLTRFRVRVSDTEVQVSGNYRDTRIRSAYEFLLVLENYRHIHGFDDLYRIFPEARKYHRIDGTDLGFVLGLIMVELATVPMGQLFGLELVREAITDPVRGPNIESIYGFSAADLIKLTGNYDVFSIEELTVLRTALQELDEAKGLIQQLTEKKQFLISSVEAQREDIEYHKQTIERLTAQVSDQSIARIKAEKALADISTSTSWLLMSPVRNVLMRFPKLARLGRITVKGIWWILTGQLMKKLRARRAFFNMTSELSLLEETLEIAPKIRYIPYYLDQNPLKRDFPKYNTNIKVAIHFHLDDKAYIYPMMDWLRNVPIEFDLFISVYDLEDISDIQDICNASLDLVSSVCVDPVSICGINLASMVEKFGSRLSRYDIVGHFHLTKASATPSDTGEIDALLGGNNDNQHTVGQIFELLQVKAKAVFTEEINCSTVECDKYEDNVENLARIVEKYSGVPYRADEVHFSPCTGFWANADAIYEFLNFPIKSEDFASDEISNIEMIGTALDQLLHIVIDRAEGDIVCLYKTDSIKDYRYFENQEDWTSEVYDSDVKFLSYYLPQFHPTPENDEWHGKGFTEWTKVRAANPLFEGHYQQHIPHFDTGYYYLDNPEYLQVQADKMHKAGVHGMVFYHYWFGGRLILEEPARMLLENKDIPMRYCFCWANENWTKRWDGNESEILLGQNYSVEDAEAFIRYLVPFFKDDRYIKVKGRPVLFVYRPSHIDSAKDYIDIWRNICVEEGLREPYVVAVLTRGTTNPSDFSMDAGVERVLHDWTDGVVPEIKHTLKQYVPMKGSVLSYAEVAEFYGSQTDAKDFTFFRSVVPMWDNTPRYNDAGLMLHGGTPQDFQAWLERSIDYSRKHLPIEERFILVNAWNEWAEGAHLEPDTKHGYAYLNSIGRALAGKSYSDTLNEETDFEPTTTVFLWISDLVEHELRKDPVLFEKFVWCLNNSTIFNRAQVSISSLEIAVRIENKTLSIIENPDFVVEFRSTCLFEKSSIELMVRTAYKTSSKVIPNFYGDEGEPIELTANGSIGTNSVVRSPIVVIPNNMDAISVNVRMRTDARCFITLPSLASLEARPTVTTVIRVHNSAALPELKNALYSLFAMIGCDVIPLLVTQDFTQEKKNELDLLLAEFKSNEHFRPKVFYFYSPDGKGDIRSKLLNEGLRSVDSRYAAFLDYDDLLQPIAYEWLVSRLQTTGKAISFGRVYTARYDTEQSIMFERLKSYEYGYSYEDFIDNNHAPIHSFMIDLSQINLDKTEYYDDHKYMEDYYLTLQIVTKDNADWSGLGMNRYIGDYVHSINRNHTIANLSDSDRSIILENDVYILCEQRISNLKNHLLGKHSLQSTSGNPPVFNLCDSHNSH